MVHSNEGIGDNADHPWEESRGIGTSYGYNRFETPHHYLTSKQLIDILIDKVSNGGNFLLNVGPDADGIIPPIMQERLLDMGKWLKVNGEAIYGSHAWRSRNKPIRDDICFTLKDNNLYMILKQWTDKPVALPNITNVANVKLLGYEGKIDYTLRDNILSITPPQLTIDKLPSHHAWVIKIENFRE